MKHLRLLLMALFCAVVSGAWAAPGDEIKSPSDVVSGKSYYIKGVYTSSKVDYTMYYGPTETDAKNTKVSSSAVTDITKAMKVKFTQVEGGWTLQTPNGNYIRPHTSNGQTYFVEDAFVMQLADGTTKEGANKGIKIGPYTSGTDNWYIQSNKTSNKIGAYKATQYDVTLIECEAESTDPSSAVTFADETPSIAYPATSQYTQVATAADGYTGTITYSITANTAGATISGATVTVTQEGSVTVKAVAEAVEGSFKESTATYTLTVTDSRAANGLAYAVTTQTVYVGETLDAPTLTNPNNLAVTYSSGDEDIATVDAEGNVKGIAKGATTITATYAGSNEYKAGSVSYTINVKQGAPAGALFYESVSGYTGSTDVSSALSTSYSNLDSDNWSSFTKVFAGKVLSGDENGHLKFGSKDEAGSAVTKSIALTGTGILTYKVQRYDSSNNGKLTISVTGATASGDTEVTGTSAWVEKTVTLTDAEGSVVITFATDTSDKRIRVDDILLVAAQPITIAEACTDGESYYGTFYTNKAYKMPAGVVGQTVAVDANGKLNVATAYNSNDIVPANTALLLKAETFGTKTAVLTTGGTAATNNDLKGTLTADETTTGGDKYYRLTMHNGTDLGFYYGAAEGAAFKPGANKAYLPVSGTGAKLNGFAIGGNEETTAIESLNVERGTLNVDTPIYNLAGQRVGKEYKGIVVVNGKKYVNK